jgi:uncharacterized SAM-binding protein YcdF (DUF218 family)
MVPRRVGHGNGAAHNGRILHLLLGQIPFADGGVGNDVGKIGSSVRLRAGESRLPGNWICEPLPASLISCKFIVVLGAGYGTTADRPATGQLTAPALARITEAVRLSSLLPEARIIVCGPDLGNGVTHASQLARAAISLGVASHRITRIDQANDTEAEAADIRQIVGDQRVALVTSASHMPRASALFRGKGLSLLPCPTGFVTQEYDTFTVSQLAFDPDSLRSSSAALHERLGMMWSGLRGKTAD